MRLIFDYCDINLTTELNNICSDWSQRREIIKLRDAVQDQISPTLNIHENIVLQLFTQEDLFRQITCLL